MTARPARPMRDRAAQDSIRVSEWFVGVFTFTFQGFYSIYLILLSQSEREVLLSIIVWGWWGVADSSRE